MTDVSELREKIKSFGNGNIVYYMVSYYVEIGRQAEEGKPKTSRKFTGD